MNTYYRGQRVELPLRCYTRMTKLAAAAAAGASTITLDDATGYSANDYLIVSDGRATEEFLQVGSVTGRVVTLKSTPDNARADATLRHAHAANEPVGKLTAPTTVVLTVENAAGSESAHGPYALADLTADPVAGRYVVGFVVPDLAASVGRWKARAVTTGVDAGSVEVQFDVASTTVG